MVCDDDGGRSEGVGVQRRKWMKDRIEDLGQRQHV